MGMWLIQVSLIKGILIGIELDVYSRRTFKININLALIQISLGFSDYAMGVCIFGHIFDTRGLNKWVRKLREIPTNS